MRPAGLCNGRRVWTAGGLVAAVFCERAARTTRFGLVVLKEARAAMEKKKDLAWMAARVFPASHSLLVNGPPMTFPSLSEPVLPNNRQGWRQTRRGFPSFRIKYLTCQPGIRIVAVTGNILNPITLKGLRHSHRVHTHTHRQILAPNTRAPDSLVHSHPTVLRSMRITFLRIGTPRHA